MFKVLNEYCRKRQKIKTMNMTSKSRLRLFFFFFFLLHQLTRQIQIYRDFSEFSVSLLNWCRPSNYWVKKEKVRIGREGRNFLLFCLGVVEVVIMSWVVNIVSLKTNQETISHLLTTLKCWLNFSKHLDEEILTLQHK